jgi:ribonuclease E
MAAPRRAEAQAAPEAPAPAPAPARPRAAAPVIPAYALPLADLEGLAAQAGLQWVNSDAEKIAAVQAAMAAEPRPIHVPREPRPPVVIDEGPLVLVETRKDLSQMTLPFERG